MSSYNYSPEDFDFDDDSSDDERFFVDRSGDSSTWKTWKHQKYSPKGYQQALAAAAKISAAKKKTAAKQK